MVHCRSVMGAWKHAQRSYLRGYLSRPPVAIGVELPLPPPPPLPLSFGDVFPVPLTRSKWIDLCDEEENGLDSQQKARPPGVVPFLVDAPMPAKDISLPTTLYLSILVEAIAAEAPSVTPESKEIIITDDFLEQPSTNGIILEQPSTNGDTDQVRKAALLSEVRELRLLVESLQFRELGLLVESMRADAESMRAGFQAELKSLSAGVVSAKGLVSTLAAGSESTGSTDRAPIYLQNTGTTETIGHTGGLDLVTFCTGTAEHVVHSPCAVGDVEGDSVCLDSVVDEVHLNLQSLRVYSFVRANSDMWNACMTNVYPVPTVLSEEECARIRFKLLNDDCMKLNDEDLCYFACLSSFSACSAYGHDDQSCNEFFSRALSQNVGIGRLASA